MKIPGLIIAGTNSGCGKTTISIGIMSALSKRGLRVKPFKVGPDYIDPMFHSHVTGTSSSNLDIWMMKEDIIKYLYAKNSNGGDISVVEGVMGYFDGFGGISMEGSTSHLSKIIKAPVILVVNGEGMSLSIGAIINGFKDFDEVCNIKGVIINRVKSQSHYYMLKGIIERNTGINVYGYLKPMDEIVIKSRHLGLISSSEISDLDEKINILSAQIEETVDLDGLLELSKQSKDMDFTEPQDTISMNEIKSINKVKYLKKQVKIGVPKDKAFCFYYNDNLNILKELGAELCEFSPMNDKSLPNGLDGLYIGGGYPEVFAKELSENIEMKNSIKTLIEKGIPTYAECGGLMYLSRAIHMLNDEVYEMLGIIPGITKMTKTLSHFGYIEIQAICDNSIAKKSQLVRGHEFHYSQIELEEEVESSWEVHKKRITDKVDIWNCGYKKHNLVAGYPHIHFYSDIDLAKQFIENCIQYSDSKWNGVL